MGCLRIVGGLLGGLFLVDMGHDTISAPDLFTALADGKQYREFDFMQNRAQPFTLFSIGLVHGHAKHRWVESRREWVFHVVWKGQGRLREGSTWYDVVAPCLMVLKPYVEYEQWAHAENPWSMAYLMVHGSSPLAGSMFKDMHLRKTVIPLCQETWVLPALWDELLLCEKQCLEMGEAYAFSAPLRVLALMTRAQKGFSPSYAGELRFSKPPAPRTAKEAQDEVMRWDPDLLG